MPFSRAQSCDTAAYRLRGFSGEPFGGSRHFDIILVRPSEPTAYSIAASAAARLLKPPAGSGAFVAFVRPARHPRYLCEGAGL